MHVLYLHQYFSTRAGFTGTRSYEFARRMVARRHRVTMITSARGNQRELAVPPGQSYAEVNVDGIDVIALPAGYANPQTGTGMSPGHRGIQFLWFASLAAWIGRRCARPDVVFATHTPLTIGIPGIALSRYFRVPFVFEVRDLWPEALVNIGALDNPLLIAAMSRAARLIYRCSAHIVALSPGMKEGIVRTGISSDRVSVISNGCDLDLFRPDRNGRAARERLGIGNRFAAIYFGAMGLANGLHYVIEAAKILKQRANDRIVIVLHGQGGKRRELERAARAFELENVIFSDPVPDKEAVADIVAGCDACLTIYAATDKETTWSPNKMFDALAAGKPVLINVSGWLGDTIEANDCGRFVDPARPLALAAALEELAADPGLRDRMGRNARALAQREFGRDRLTDKLEQVLMRVVAPT